MGKEIKNIEEILVLLEAIWLPKRVSIVHCKGHQKVILPEGRGKSMAGAQFTTDWNVSQGQTDRETRLATQAKQGWWVLPEVDISFP